MNKKYKTIILAVATTILFAACNKTMDTMKGISVQVAGYNISNDSLVISVDTVVYDKDKVVPDKLINFQRVYTYPSQNPNAVLSIKNVKTGKELFQQKLPLGGGELELFYPFINMNGTPMKIPTPKAKVGTDLLGMYIHYPETVDEIDIVLENTDKQRVYLAKNVKPGNWIYIDYIAAPGFDEKSKIDGGYIYFLKAGTTDEWAFNSSQYSSQSQPQGMQIPYKKPSGLVQLHFMAPSGSQLNNIRLFKRYKDW